MKLYRSSLALPVLSRGLSLLSMIAFLHTVAMPSTTEAQTEQVLYRFAGQPDGENPSGSLVMDAKGNVYGTTNAGGEGRWGSVFSISKTGQEKVLYSFTGGQDGFGPAVGLLRSKGELYGTAISGGVNSFGTVFRLTPTGKETTLASFSSSDGGGYPEGRLIQDKAGNLYGTNSGFNGGYGNGAVFKVSPTGTKSILYTFAGGTDGMVPYGGLIQDNNGNFYGTTYRGGGASDRGTIYRLTSDGQEAVLYSFTGGADGSLPAAELVRDTQGNLYGTTTGGGTEGNGTIFELTTDGREMVLHNFNGRDGYYPIANLIRDTQGNLYGTTEFGGRRGLGTVFELTTNGKLKTLHHFRGGRDGANPTGGLVVDAQGILYGSTSAGGGSPNCSGGCGVVYMITPAAVGK